MGSGAARMMRRGLPWLALAVGFSPVLLDLGRNLLQAPEDRLTLLVAVLIGLSLQRAGARRAPSLRGAYAVLAGLLLQFAGIATNTWSLARLGLPLGVLGMARLTGSPRAPIAALTLFLVPLPDSLVSAFSPRLEAWLGGLGAALVRSVGGTVEATGPTLRGPSGSLALLASDGGLVLAHALAAVGWYGGVRAGESGWGCAVRAAGNAILAAPLQCLGIVVAALAVGFGAPQLGAGWLHGTFGPLVAGGALAALLVAARKREEPLHEAGPADPAGAGRVLLLLSPHFPPRPTAGSLRWQKLLSEAAVRGWRAEVITAHPGDLEQPEWERLEELPAGTRVYGVQDSGGWPDRIESLASRLWRGLRGARRAALPTPEPAGSTWLPREELCWPPRGVRDWARAYHAGIEYGRERVTAGRMARLALRVARRTRPQLIVSCGPPHMVHEAARRVAAVTGAPLVTDFRDPWSLLNRLPEAVASPLWFLLARRYEARALAQAGLVVMNTEPARDAMRHAYPELGDRVCAVLNGFDDEAVPPRAHGETFRVVYAGSIYIDRDPLPLFRAAAALVEEERLSPDDLVIELIGHVAFYGNVPVDRLAEREGIGPFVRIRPPMPRRQLWQVLASAAILVSLPQDLDLAIPSKVFEYMLFDAWLLALATPASATARLLNGTGADVVAPRDVDAICAVLRRHLEAFRKGERPPRLARDPRLGRRGQAARLFDRIDALVTAPVDP